MDSPRERRAALHHAVVREAVERLLARKEAQVVVDLGGGTGGLAVRVAALGHQVTVVDPSPDALAALLRRAREAGVDGRIDAVQGDLDTLTDQVDQVDLVLCHGVLGHVDGGVDEALASIAGVLVEDGALSLVVAQRHAAVLGRAMSGRLAQARAVLDGADPGERRFTAEELVDLVAASGLSLDAIHGVRVFAELVPSALLDLEPGAVDQLLGLERAVADRPEYRTLAAQLHVLARR